MFKGKKCSSHSYVKSGHIRGLQRYRCKGCGCQFTQTAPRGVSPVLKNLAVLLYAYCGVSMLGIARLFKVSDVAVLKWIRKASGDIALPKTAAEIVQIDELWHFVNGKKTLYGSGAPLMGYRVTLLDGSWVIVAMPAFKSLFKTLTPTHAIS